MTNMSRTLTLGASCAVLAAPAAVPAVATATYGTGSASEALTYGTGSASEALHDGSYGTGTYGTGKHEEARKHVAARKAHRAHLAGKFVRISFR